MKMKMKNQLVLAAWCGLTILTGCSQDAGTSSEETPSVDGSPFLLSEEPAGAGEVISVRETSKDGDDVVVVGRIGGSADPWISGRAAFSIVDNSLRACSDIPEDKCPIPWDYCCETHKLATSTALIKVVDSDGKLVKADAKNLLGVEELSTVVVQGKAERDEAGNLTVLATGVYVKKK